jgi:hypothetical protein
MLKICSDAGRLDNTLPPNRKEESKHDLWPAGVFTVVSTVCEFLAAKLRNVCKALQRLFVRLTYESQCRATQRKRAQNAFFNYKSAALNQLSYAGVPIRKLFSAG